MRYQQGSDATRITVGYGAGGGDPLVLTVDAGEHSDTGFFKLFVFSKYVDMDWLKQESAFEMLHRRKVQQKPDVAEIWDAWVLPVTVDTKL